MSKTNIDNIQKTHTIESIHKQNIATFNNEFEKIKDYNIEINECEEKLKNNNLSLYDKARLLDKCDELRLKIKNAERNKINYYDKTNEILIQYYTMSEPEPERINILKLLNPKADVLNKKENNKSNLFNTYCLLVNGNRVIKDNGSNRLKYCSTCGIEEIYNINDSSFVCVLCGNIETIILDEEHKIKDYSPYKKINRFREWLNGFQGKQSPDIDEHVYEDIHEELKRRRITDYSTITPKIMKSILKKIKCNNLYEHAIFIINKLTGIDSPKITKDTEKLFIKMFKDIQVPWTKFKPPGRKNFISYSFILHKFCELLGLDHLLVLFPLHKQHDILFQAESIWDKICTYLNWQYITSI